MLVILFGGRQTYADTYTASAFATVGAGPVSMVFDSSGNLYTANYGDDSNAGTVSKVSPSGVVTTLYNGGLGSHPAGVLLDASGNLYVTDTGHNDILRITPGGTVSVWANVGSRPWEIVSDSAGNLYTGNQSSDGNISKVTPQGGVSTIYVSSSYVTSLAFDASGNLYAGTCGYGIYKVTPSGTVTLFSSAQFCVIAMAFDSSGNLYSTDDAYRTLYKTTPSGSATQVATIGAEAFGLIFDSAGNLYIANEDSQPKIQMLTPSGTLSTVLSGGAPNSPFAFAYDTSGMLYVADAAVNIIYKVFKTPPSCSVTFDSNPIAYGTQTTMHYNSINATTFYINTVGYVGSSGSAVIAPLATTDYSGSVSGPTGSGTCPTTLTVIPPSVPVAQITASSTTIFVGQSTGLDARFTAGTGDTLTADNIDSPVGTGLGATTNPDAHKYVTFTPAAAGTYTFYARAQTSYYSTWTSYSAAIVRVLPATQCSVTLSPTSISSGGSSVLSYSSQGATNFSINNIGLLIRPNTSGSQNVSPSQTTDYTGTAQYSGSGTTQTIFLTSGTSWSVPTDWNSTGNTIEVIGGGGGGGGASALFPASGGGGGGGGAYAKISNLALTPNASVTYQIGSAGAGGSIGSAGGDTYFNGTGSTCASQSVCAKGGSGGGFPTAGSGGIGSGASIGTTVYAGGSGISGSSVGGTGGGAAGRVGAGRNSVQLAGGAGDTGSGGAGGGAVSSGASGAEWATGYGSGGGGGYVGSNTVGTTGGNYGAGGGGGGRRISLSTTGGNGSQGLIVITYTPAVTATNTCPATLSVSCTPTYSCSGSTIQHTDSSCSVTSVTTCVAPSFCSPGSSSCLYPAPSFTQGTAQDGTILTGHLQVKPTLVAKNVTVKLYWNVSNTSGCIVAGSDGENWSGSSGAKVSIPITQQTVFTLACTGLDSSTVNESQTVNISPTFQER